MHLKLLCMILLMPQMTLCTIFSQVHRFRLIGISPLFSILKKRFYSIFLQVASGCRLEWDKYDSTNLVSAQFIEWLISMLYLILACLSKVVYLSACLYSPYEILCFFCVRISLTSTVLLYAWDRGFVCKHLHGVEKT